MSDDFKLITSVVSLFYIIILSILPIQSLLFLHKLYEINSKQFLFPMNELNIKYML